jgi:hypothetical protein
MTGVDAYLQREFHYYQDTNEDSHISTHESLLVVVTLFILDNNHSMARASIIVAMNKRHNAQALSASVPFTHLSTLLL